LIALGVYERVFQVYASRFAPPPGDHCASGYSTWLSTRTLELDPDSTVDPWSPYVVITDTKILRQKSLVANIGQSQSGVHGSDLQVIRVHASPMLSS
jgi:hypothetical protein